MLGDWLRDLKQFTARVQFEEHCPTVAAEWRTDYGLPPLDRFPQFSAISRKRSSIGAQAMPKTAEIDQTWPFFPLPTFAVGVSRRVSSTQSRAFAGMTQPLRVLNPRSRVCGVSLLATGQGNMRILLTVADNRRSAAARGLNGKMANLFRFAPFRGQVQVQSVPMKWQ